MGNKYAFDKGEIVNNLLATEVTPRLLAGAEPDAHQFYVTVVYRWGDRMEANSKQYHSNSKLGQACIGE
jgi:hypothetical protein